MLQKNNNRQKVYFIKIIFLNIYIEGTVENMTKFFMRITHQSFSLSNLNVEKLNINVLFSSGSHSFV